MRNLKNMIFGATLLALGTGAAVAAGNTIVVTDVANAKANRIISLDMQSAGDTAAFQFALDLPAGSSNVNTSKCLSELPKGYSGICEAKGSRVAAVIFGANNSNLPAGMVSLGTISFNGSQAKSGGITVTDVVGSAASGTASQVTAEVASEGTNTQQQ